MKASEILAQAEKLKKLRQGIAPGRVSARGSDSAGSGTLPQETAGSPGSAAQVIPRPPQIPPMVRPNSYQQLMKKHDRLTQRHLT